MPSSSLNSESGVKHRPAFLADIYRSDSKIARFLLVIILHGVSYSLYRGVQDNYLAEIIHITPFERGIVEFLRETPGLCVVLILALMYRFTDSRIFKIGIAIMAGSAAGVLMTSISPFLMSKFVVVFFMVLYSAGEHIIMPVRSSISMDLAKKEKSGASLGITGSLGQLGQIAGFLIVTLIFLILAKKGLNRTDLFGYRIAFGLSVALMVASTLVVLALRETTLKAARQRFYFAKKFTKYYMIETFQGARKQVFITFAPYVLILHYGADPSVMSALYAVCAIFGMLCSPLIGRLIDKVGYKFVLVGNGVILILICILYGYAHLLFAPAIAFAVVCCNFVLDSVISLGGMAANVYVQRISSTPEEIPATLSTGISVNHIISILIALLGGWIWKVTGIEVLFAISAFLGLVQAIYSMTVKKSEENQAGVHAA